MERKTGPTLVRCRCGAKLAIPGAAAGRKVKCPKCGTVASIPPAAGSPRAAAPRQAPPAERPAAEADDDVGYGIVESERLEALLEPSPADTAQAKCPKCQAALAAQAVLCVACGYDFKAGRVLKTEREKPAKRRSGARGDAVLSGAAAFFGSLFDSGLAKVLLVSLVLFAGLGLIRYLTLPGPPITMLEPPQRVTAQFLSGGAVQVDDLRTRLSIGAIHGTAELSTLKLASNMAKAAEPKEEGDGPRASDTAIDQPVIRTQRDPAGPMLLVRVRLSRKFLEDRGKVKNLTAVIGCSDFQLNTSAGPKEPMLVVPGQRSVADTPDGKATRFVFGRGDVVTLPGDVPDPLWVPRLSVEQTQELSGTMDVACLFEAPESSDGLTLEIAGSDPVPLGR